MPASNLALILLSLWSTTPRVHGFLTSTQQDSSAGVTRVSSHSRSFRNLHYSNQESSRRRRNSNNLDSVRTILYSSRYSYENENDEEDDDDDDDYIDTDSLGDWRNFRRSLTLSKAEENDDEDFIAPTTKVSSKRAGGRSQKSPSISSASSPIRTTRIKSVSKDNEEVLQSQNKKLAKEYMTGVWAHETSTAEVGGLVIRLPLEMELFRNHRHSLMGRRLKRLLDKERMVAGNQDLEMSTWYSRSKRLIEDEMGRIANMADEEGQIDATQLKEEASEMLSLYLDNQETWQEVCLVVERNENTGYSKTLVLNRPMAFKLTENLAKLVLYGAFQHQKKFNIFESRIDLVRFMTAFKNECAVYVGGPDEQGNAAVMIHGIEDLPGSVEISPGSKIYQGGIQAAMDGVLSGKYNPLEFRFFVGCHSHEESSLDVAVLLGKYQPIACARSVALKQCISLPKPLWHEVAELCGGDLTDLSSLELLKRDDLQFQVVDETDYDDDDDDIEIIDELSELEIDDDEEEFFL